MIFPEDQHAPVETPQRVLPGLDSALFDSQDLEGAFAMVYALQLF